MTDAPPDPQPKLDIDWLKTLAGALAAVTTAVLLSTLGAAGTLIGAAVGSVAATVATALYSQGLATSRQKVAKVAKENALAKVGVAQAEVRRAARRRGDTTAVDAHLEHADEQLARAQQALDQPAARSWRTLPWRRVALLAGGTFVAAMVVLLAFEAIGGKPVSSYTGGTSGSGGTSISRLGGSGDTGSDDRDDSGDRDRDQRKQQDDRDEQDDPSPTPSGEPTQQPSDTPAPSQAPTETPTQAPSENLGGTTEPSPAGPSDLASAPAG